MADPTQTPPRGDWECPCAGCTKSAAWERKQIIQDLEALKLEYQFDVYDNIIRLSLINDIVKLIENRRAKSAAESRSKS